MRQTRLSSLTVRPVPLQIGDADPTRRGVLLLSGRRPSWRP